MTSKHVRLILVDPRLFIGIVLILAGGMLGAFLLSNEKLQPFVEISKPVPRGASISDSVAIVELPVSQSEGRLPAKELSAQMVASHPLAVGEIVSRSDVDLIGGVEFVDIDVPLVNAPVRSLEPGTVVEVWALPAKTARRDDSRAHKVSSAEVVHVSTGNRLVGGPQAQLRFRPGSEGEVVEALGRGESLMIAVPGGGR